jgi:hypothetical protein
VAPFEAPLAGDVTGAGLGWVAGSAGAVGPETAPLIPAFCFDPIV